MSKSNGYGTATEVPTKPEQRTKAELRQLIETDKLDGALALAKRMHTEQAAAQVVESKSQALELIKQAAPWGVGFRRHYRCAGDRGGIP